MRSEVKVNFATLAYMVESLTRYETAILDMDKSLKIISDTADTNKGEAFEKLRNVKEDFSNMLSICLEEVQDVRDVVERYVQEMTSIIAPVNRNEMIIVDKLDVKVNMVSLKSHCQGIGSVGRDISGPMRMTWAKSSDPEIQAEYNKNQEKLTEMKRAIKYNGVMIMDIYDNIQKIYDNKIAPFENKDDEFSKQMMKIYDKRTSTVEWWRELFFDVGDFLAGAFDSIGGLIQGIFCLAEGILEGILSTAVYGMCTLEEQEPPKWAKEGYEKTKEMGQKILSGEIVEDIAQSSGDMWEEKGPVYMMGNISTDLVGAKAAIKGLSVLGKAKPIVRGTKTVDKIDDIVDNKATNIKKAKESKIDDLSSKEKLQGNMNDKASINNIGNTIKKTDSVTTLEKVILTAKRKINAITNYVIDVINKGLLSKEAKNKINKAINILEIYDEHPVITTTISNIQKGAEHSINEIKQNK